MEKSQAPVFKRRKFFINRSFQTRFIVKFLLILLLAGVVSIVLTLLTTKGTLTSSFVDSKLVIQKTSLAIMPSVIYTNIITTAVVGLVAIVVVLLVSHKIAGPMFRFDKDIVRVSKGDLKSKIHIRNGDQFEEIASSLNVMISSLNAKISSIRKTVDDLADAAEKQDAAKELTQEIKNIQDKIDSSFTL